MGESSLRYSTGPLVYQTRAQRAPAFKRELIARMGQHPTLAKGIYDASWGMFANVLSEKAASAARTYVAVNPAYTSQDCSSCGTRQAMPLSQRVYRCPNCGMERDRDHNAALNILAVGLHSVGLAPGSLRF